MRLRGRAVGFTMMDCIFLMMLVTVVLIPMAGLFPMGHVTVQKAKNISVSLYLAKEQINEVRTHFPNTLTGAIDTPVVTTTVVTINGINYTITRSIWTIQTRQWIFQGQTNTECCMVDVDVVVTYPRGMPFTYDTRLWQDMDKYEMK